jgi:WD40 repeat protein
MGALSGSPGQYWSVAISPDGTTLAASALPGQLRFSDGVVDVWDLRARKRIHTFAHFGAMHLLFGDDNKTLVAGGRGPGNEGIHIYDVEQKTMRAELTGQPGSVTCLAISPDHRLLAAGEFGGMVRLWDLTERRRILSLQHRGGVLALSFSPDGRTLAAGTLDDQVHMWNVEYGVEVATLPTYASTISLCFSAAGDRLIAACFDQTIRVWHRDGQSQFVPID